MLCGHQQHVLHVVSMTTDCLSTNLLNVFINKQRHLGRKHESLYRFYHRMCVCANFIFHPHNKYGRGELFARNIFINLVAKVVKVHLFRGETAAECEWNWDFVELPPERVHLRENLVINFSALMAMILAKHIFVIFPLFVRRKSHSTRLNIHST